MLATSARATALPGARVMLWPAEPPALGCGRCIARLAPGDHARPGCGGPASVDPCRWCESLKHRVFHGLDGGPAGWELWVDGHTDWDLFICPEIAFERSPGGRGNKLEGVIGQELAEVIGAAVVRLGSDDDDEREVFRAWFDVLLALEPLGLSSGAAAAYMVGDVIDTAARSGDVLKRFRFDGGQADRLYLEQLALSVGMVTAGGQVLTKDRQPVTATWLQAQMRSRMEHRYKEFRRRARA